MVGENTDQRQNRKWYVGDCLRCEGVIASFG